MFDAIVRSNGWDDATSALQLLSHLEQRIECGSFGAGVEASITSGTGGYIDWDGWRIIGANLRG